jgi:hypothetical protein
VAALYPFNTKIRHKAAGGNHGCSKVAWQISGFVAGFNAKSAKWANYAKQIRQDLRRIMFPSTNLHEFSLIGSRFAQIGVD